MSSPTTHVPSPKLVFGPDLAAGASASAGSAACCGAGAATVTVCVVETPAAADVVDALLPPLTAMPKRNATTMPTIHGHLRCFFGGICAVGGAHCGWPPY